MKKLLVILGPTATGKTELALQLACKFQGELVSVDSRQVYTGMDIGTGKLPGSGKWLASRSEEVRRGNKRWEVGGIKIWMYDVISPKIQYTVADYVKDANRGIVEVRKRGKLPIIVGGGGLYLKALLEGLDSLSIPADQKLRKNLQKLSLNQLQKKLKKINLNKWQSMNQSDRQNPRRLIRAIELKISPGRSPYGHLPGVSSAYDVLKIGLTAPREVLYKLVDERVVNRIKQGMIDEAKKLHKNGLTLKRMRQLGLEYGVLADYLDGEIREIEGDRGLIRIMQGKIHGFIRRQITWFKKEKEVCWFDITEKDFPKNVEKIVTKWYHQAHATKN